MGNFPEGNWWWPDGTHLQTLELTLGLKQEVQGSGESVEICAVAQGGIEAAVKGGTRGKRFSSDPKEAPECPKKKTLLGFACSPLAVGILKRYPAMCRQSSSQYFILNRVDLQRQGQVLRQCYGSEPGKWSVAYFYKHTVSRSGKGNNAQPTPRSSHFSLAAYIQFSGVSVWHSKVMLRKTPAQLTMKWDI